jgi:hypothetical protein
MEIHDANTERRGNKIQATEYTPPWATFQGKNEVIYSFLMYMSTVKHKFHNLEAINI